MEVVGGLMDVVAFGTSESYGNYGKLMHKFSIVHHRT